MTKIPEIKHIAVLGAGAIGFYIGAAWAGALSESDVELTLIGRQKILSVGGQREVLLTGRRRVIVPVEKLVRTDQPASLADADLVLVAVKATALDAAIKDLKAHAKNGATIISLLNGLEPARKLKAAMPEHCVIAGMVPFNVVWKADNHLHCSSAGDLSLARSEDSIWLTKKVEQSSVPIDLHENLEPIQYGKLLLNLANPINALSGIPLHDMLSTKAYRQVYAATLSEALMVYDKANIDWQKVGPFSPRVASRLLNMPDFLFNNSILRLQKIDRTSTTSMAVDLRNNRSTEIDVINGEIVRLAEEAGLRVPINRKLVALVHTAEKSASAPKMGANELKEALGL